MLLHIKLLFEYWTIEADGAIFVTYTAQKLARDDVQNRLRTDIVQYAISDELTQALEEAKEATAAKRSLLEIRAGLAR